MAHTQKTGPCDLNQQCGKIYDDPEEDNGTQAWRIWKFREEGKRQKGGGREEQITVDPAPRARGNAQLNWANGPEEIIVTEMLKELPLESIKEIMKMVPTQDSWRMRLSKFLENCAVGVPTESRCFSTKKVFEVIGPSRSCRRWRGTRQWLCGRWTPQKNPKGWGRLHVEAGRGAH